MVGLALGYISCSVPLGLSSTPLLQQKITIDISVICGVIMCITVAYDHHQFLLVFGKPKGTMQSGIQSLAFVGFGKPNGYDVRRHLVPKARKWMRRWSGIGSSWYKSRKWIGYE